MTHATQDAGLFRPTLQAFVLAFLCAGAFLVHLDVGEVGLMEARNFVAAREIAEGGSWIVPTMNGEIRIKKPPFPTWLAALARMAAGNVDHVAAMRVPSGLVAMLMVFAFWSIHRELFGARQDAFLAACILATSLQVIQMGRSGFWDIFSQSFVILGLWATVLSLRRERYAGWVVASGVFYGLCVLSKGPVSFYTTMLPFAVAYGAAFGFSDFRKAWGRLACILALTVILGSSWFAYLFVVHPEEARSIFAAEAEARVTGHHGPVWYYLNFPMYAGVWIVPTVAGMVVPFIRRREPWQREGIFALVWLALSVVTLSILPEKKERYLLPASLPMALVAWYMVGRIRDRLAAGARRGVESMVLNTHVVLMVSGLALLPVFFMYYLPEATRQAETGRLVIVSLAFSVLALALLYFRLRVDVPGVVLTTAAAVWVLCAAGLPLMKPLFVSNPEHRRLYEVRDLPELKGVPLYEFYDSDSSFMEMVWDIGRKVKRVRRIDSLDPAKVLPIAVISETPVEGRLPEAWKGRVRVEPIGVFDYNQRAPGNKTHLAILRPAGDSTISEKVP